MWKGKLGFNRSRQQTIHTAIESYCDNLNLARLTRRQYRTGLRRFEEYLIRGLDTDSGVAPLDAVTPQSVRRFIISLKDYAPSTERVYAYALYGFLEDLVSDPAVNFDLDINQIKRYGRRRLRTPPRRLPHFPKRAIKQLVDYAVNMDPAEGQTSLERISVLRAKALILTLADTGLRIHEACKLVNSDIDRRTKKANIIGKGSKEAIVRFTDRAVSAIDAYLDARHDIVQRAGRSLDTLPVFIGHDRRGLKQLKAISTNGARNVLADVVRRVHGVKNQTVITPHMLRHYFVTNAMIRSGGNLRVAQELARHSSLATTERYAHLDERELDEQYKNIFEIKR